MSFLSKDLLSRLRDRVRRAYWHSVTPVRTVRARHWGDHRDPRNTGLCLFSTFDPGGVVDPYVMRYLREIESCGFDIVFVSTSPKLSEADVSELKPHVRLILHRENVGLDFGSWRASTQILGDWSRYERLLLTNDSIYGPFSDLKPLMDRCEAEDAEVVGLTDSHEIGYHLQSFFIYVKRPVLASKTMSRFIESIKLKLDKKALIRAYEVGFSRILLSHGYKLKALYPFTAIKEFATESLPGHPYRGKVETEPLNQTLYFWSTLLKSFGFPFLKTEVLKTNRMRLPEISEWRSLISDGKGEWPRLIENHLKRVHPDAEALKH
jgi:hypothetical protein